MTAPALAHDTDHGRMYSRSTSEQPLVPSITTIISQQATDLSGWHGYMAAKALAHDERLMDNLHDRFGLRKLIKDASLASQRHRNHAAGRGDRVHFYAEQLGRAQLGEENQLDAALRDLQDHGEEDFGMQVTQWFSDFGVRVLATELTVWNQEVGYAGTLDLIAEIAGRVCIIDFKTKSEDRGGFLKPLDPKVAMQLVAGFRAQEQLVDPVRGIWEPFEYADADMLLAVGIGAKQAVTMQADPELLPLNWRKFWALRQVWGAQADLAEVRRQLIPLGPPPGVAHAFDLDDDDLDDDDLEGAEDEGTTDEGATDPDSENDGAGQDATAHDGDNSPEGDAEDKNGHAGDGQKEGARGEDGQDQ